jgi:hypothetical protein
VADIARFSITVIAFALLITTHLAIAVGLLSRSRGPRAALALVIAPVAPYLAVREHMWFRAGIWIVSALIYVGMLVAQSI